MYLTRGELNINKTQLPFNFWRKINLVISRRLVLGINCASSMLIVQFCNISNAGKGGMEVGP